MQPTPAGTDYLSPEEAMGLLKVSKTKFYSLLRARELPPPARISPRNPRWTRAELVAWLEGRRDA